MKGTPRIQADLIHIAWALTLYRFASNIVGVFIPFVILESGGKLWTVALFYLLYAAFKLCTNYSCMRLIQTKGAYLGLGLGFGFSALQTVSILGYSQFHTIILLVIAAASFGLTNAFLWNAQHYFISKNMDKYTKSSSIAAIEIYGRFSDIIGPALGGIIGSIFGGSWLLATALVCMFITVIPLKKMHSFHDPVDAAETIRYDLGGAPFRDVLANFSFNIQIITSKMTWPIYLAVVLQSYRSIGGVAVAAATASIITTWIAGHRGDRGKDRSVLIQGAAAASFTNLSRLVASTPFRIGVVSAAYESSLAYFSNAWVSTYYQHAQNKGSQYIISMEIACDLAYVLFWSIFFVATLLVPEKTLFNAAFLIAAVAAWGCLLISRQNIDQVQVK